LTITKSPTRCTLHTRPEGDDKQNITKPRWSCMELYVVGNQTIVDVHYQKLYILITHTLP